MRSLLDMLLYAGGHITREELRYRMVRRQSVKRWLRDYERADK